MMGKTESAKEAQVAGRTRSAGEATHQRPGELVPQVEPLLLQQVLEGGSADPGSILALQQDYGNRAVSGLIQAKLRVGPAGDRYEVEADRVAEQVLSMAGPGRHQTARLAEDSSDQRRPEESEAIQGKSLASKITPLIQRQEDEELQESPIQRVEEEELQEKPLQRQEDEELQESRLLRQEDEELQDKPLQRQEEEELQEKREQRALLRQEEEELQDKRAEKREPSPPQPDPKGAFDVGPAVADRLAARKGGGRPLPGEVRDYMEPRFGTDFGGVRVHTDAEAGQISRYLGARAFAHGRDVYMGTGHYDPGSTAGKRLLAHELTHVVQQTGSGPRRKSGHGNGGEEPPKGISGLGKHPLPGIQRLPSLEEFKESTYLWAKKRRKIRRVDREVEAYAAIPATHDQIVAKKNKLNTVINECDTYLGYEDKKAKRKTGVTQLKQKALKEKTVIEPAAESETEADPVAKLQKLTEVQEAQVALWAEDFMPRDKSFVEVDGWITAFINSLRGNPDDAKKVMKSELDQLEALSEDPNTHPVTILILKEILAKAPLVDVVIAPVGPGAKFKDEGDKSKGYVVEHMLNVPLGKAERLGSLAHEMTHVSVSQKFENTSLFLSFSKTASDEDILNLSQRRTEQLETLQGLMEGDDNLTSDMKALLLKKIRYPIETEGMKATGDIMRYAGKPKFRREMGEVMYQRIARLAARGLNNTVIEFDTVINQMMVYMTLWQIPLTSPFYSMLIDVAQEALGHRT